MTMKLPKLGRSKIYSDAQEFLTPAPPREQARYERKFLIDDVLVSELESLIRMHPLHFRQIYHPRFVNNIYLDTPHFKSYRDNINGEFYRYKVRYRWYGLPSKFEDSGTIEIKEKFGMVGTKRSIPCVMTPWECYTDVARQLKIYLNKNESPGIERGVVDLFVPALANCYMRSYWLSADGRFRVTIDSEILNKNIAANPRRSGHAWLRQERKVVLEVKYAREHDPLFSKVSQAFPFRLTKSSKYVEGVTEAYGL